MVALEMRETGCLEFGNSGGLLMKRERADGFYRLLGLSW